MVRVRAQVMSRDDSSGGWVPMGAGGLSNVSIRKRYPCQDNIDSLPKNEYFIYGTQVSDSSVSMRAYSKNSCILFFLIFT